MLLHSDGIVEAHDPQREMFGFPRLKETVGAAPGGQAMIDRVLAELERFTGADAEQEDDITMVTLQRSAGVVLWPSSSCRASPATSARRSSAWSAPCAGSGWPRARLERLKTAVGEATMNAMEHGNEYRRDRPVSIRVLHAPATRCACRSPIAASATRCRSPRRRTSRRSSRASSGRAGGDCS